MNRNNKNKLQKKILQIVIKNTSTLDFSLPLLWAIRKKYSEANICIFFTVLNKNQIIRYSDFYLEFCNTNKIELLDFSNFLKFKNHIIRKSVSLLFSSPVSDISPIKWQTCLTISGIMNIIRTMRIKFITKLEKFVIKYMVNHKSIYTLINPDLVLFDNRTVTNFSGRKEMYSFFERKKIPVVLLPHAPHYASETAEFCKFDENSDDFMPNYTEHWIPFKYGKPWKLFLNKRNQFIFIGYPGLDSRWHKNNIYKKNKKYNEKKKIKCLILTRKFYPKGYKRKQYSDIATLEYDESLNFIRSITESIKAVTSDVEFIVKPHPSSSLHQNQEIISKAGLNNFTINYDSFYNILCDIDIVISQFTTSLAIPIAYKIPTVLVNSTMQSHIMKNWPILENYYKKSTFFCELDCLSSELNFLFKNINLLDVTPKYENLRKYFDDNSLERALKRIECMDL